MNHTVVVQVAALSGTCLVLTSGVTPVAAGHLAERVTRAWGCEKVRMIDQIEVRLGVLRMTAADRLTQVGVDVEAVLRHTALAKQAVADGLLGYTLLVAEKPSPGSAVRAVRPP